MVAVVFGYVRQDVQLCDQLDKVVGTLVKRVRASLFGPCSCAAASCTASSA